MMLEKPDVPDEAIIACLHESYGLREVAIEFLPVGNDVNTAVYRVTASGAVTFFLKLRSGNFEPAIVTVPHFLHQTGAQHVIPPVATLDGRIWTRMDAFAVTLFPFVSGHNGFAAPLTRQQWVELGAALRRVHDADLPETIRAGIPRDEFSPHWRDIVRTLLVQAETVQPSDPVAQNMATFLRANGVSFLHMIERCETLATEMIGKSPRMVLCHADIHAANVLIDSSGTLYVVDWDTLIFAPKERDLMFIGGGVGGSWNRPDEEMWFYQGYGPTEIDWEALAYYRFERIIEDVAEYATRLMLTDEGGADREDGFRKFAGQLLPGHVVEMANRTNELLRFNS